MYTPQSRLVSRYPSSSVAGHYGPQLASDAWGREDDRLERAGAEDRTFDMEVDPFRPSESGSLDRLDGYTPADMGATPGHPPLPMVDSWNERNPPPLPEVCSHPLHSHMSYNRFGILGCNISPARCSPHSCCSQ